MGTLTEKNRACIIKDAEESRKAGERFQLMAESKRKDGNASEEESLSQKAGQKYETAGRLFREVGKDKEAKECDARAEDCEVLSDEEKKEILEAEKEANKDGLPSLEDLKKKYSIR